MSSNETRIDEINKKMQHMQEKQLQNKQNLIEHEDIVQRFFELNKKNDRLFARLYDYWQHDEELGHVIVQDKIEVERCYRQISNELDDRKKELHKIKQDL